MSHSVLLCDDEPGIVRALSRLFRREGVEVHADLEGRLLERARALKPDLILLDMNHVVSGLELLSALRRDEQTRGFHVVMMSGMDGERERAAAQELGVDDFLQKPFGVEEVHALCERIRNASPG